MCILFVQEHPWVTCAGRDPLPSTAQNVTSVEEVTEDDLAEAIAVPSVSYIINAVRAASRWKRFTARRTQSDSAHSEGGSTASTDMSRSGSFDVMEALASASHRGSNGKESNSGNTPLSQATSPPDEKSNSGSVPIKRNSAVNIGDDFSPHGSVATLANQIQSGGETKRSPEQLPNLSSSSSSQSKNEGQYNSKLGHRHHQRSGSSSSQSTANSLDQSQQSTTSGIKAAMSFPQSTWLGKEKRPELLSVAGDPARSSSPQTGIKSIDAMVEFPEIDRSLSHQEHMSIHGIDDSSVEVVSGPSVYDHLDLLGAPSRRY